MKNLVWTTLAALLALALPSMLIIIRNHVRRTRGDLLTEFENVFNLSGKANTSFEFAKNKYLGKDKVSPWRLYMAAIPFMLLSFAGLTLALMPITSSTNALTIHDFVAPTLFTSGGLSGDNPQYFYSTLTILTITFVGSFIFALRYLVRAIANFDLAPLTFFRVTVNMILAMAVAVTLWRTLPDLTSVFFGAKEGAAGDATVGTLWYGTAFLIGFFPDLGLNFLLERIPLPFKRDRDDLLKECAVASIEIVDGIDVWKRFRLEETDIVDVQNLAALNPIILFVETPYPFYTCFDWIAQAQLCTIVGPDRFIELRRRHIRTVFDLERAVFGPHSTEKARKIVAEVMYTTGPASRNFFSNWQRGSSENAQNAQAAFEYDGYDDETFQHLVRVSVDDLHVHRLRQLWIDIGSQLGAHSMNLKPLYDLEYPPALQDNLPEHPAVPSAPLVAA
ncbi:MAG TPA: hypothetical protein VEK31_07475 [Xanthobacteraceae bacterium]|nr:hypothetical protein [Xanthobacteraceae bacterium]